jgi:hypothetical protein
MSDRTLLRRLIAHLRALASGSLRTSEIVSTRRLIIAALVCGLAILVAFAVQVLITT